VQIGKPNGAVYSIFAIFGTGYTGFERKY
jgi:hypothetical protein